MISIDWSNLTVLEMYYLLSNYDGYVNGDKKTIEIPLEESAL
jgi:hypothetical protein